MSAEEAKMDPKPTTPNQTETETEPNPPKVENPTENIKNTEENATKETNTEEPQKELTEEEKAEIVVKKEKSRQKALELYAPYESENSGIKREIRIDFGEITHQNFGQLKKINEVTLPVIYSDDFYQAFFHLNRWCLFGIAIGNISCKIDKSEEEGEEGEPTVYIMTIGVLKPYRRLGIASMLLEKAINDYTKKNNIKTMILHVQTTNTSAKRFYEKHGFVTVRQIDNYYQQDTVEPPDCFFLKKYI